MLHQSMWKSFNITQNSSIVNQLDQINGELNKNIHKINVNMFKHCLICVTIKK